MKTEVVSGPASGFDVEHHAEVEVGSGAGAGAADEGGLDIGVADGGYRSLSVAGPLVSLCQDEWQLELSQDASLGQDTRAVDCHVRAASLDQGRRAVEWSPDDWCNPSCASDAEDEVELLLK